MSEEYTCAICGGIFTKGWSDKEAEEKLEADFSDFEKVDCDLVCYDCYKKMGFEQ